MKFFALLCLLLLVAVAGSFAAAGNFTVGRCEVDIIGTPCVPNNLDKAYFTLGGYWAASLDPCGFISGTRIPCGVVYKAPAAE